MRALLGATLVAVAANACAPATDDSAELDATRAADSTNDAGSSPTPTDEPILPPMVVTGEATDTIELTSEGPTLQFLPDRVSASAGTRVLLRYRNGGDLPHNFALFRNDDSIDRFVAEAYEAEATGYVPPSAASELIAYTPLVSPGQNAELEFVVPPPGRYTYICLFPGHAQMMLGTLTSRE